MYCTLLYCISQTLCFLPMEGKQKDYDSLYCSDLELHSQYVCAVGEPRLRRPADLLEVRQLGRAALELDPEAVRIQASTCWQKGHSILPASWEGQNPQQCQGFRDAVVDCPSLTFSAVHLSAVRPASSPSGRDGGRKSLSSWTPSSTSPLNPRKRQVLGFHRNLFHMESTSEFTLTHP